MGKNIYMMVIAFLLFVPAGVWAQPDQVQQDEKFSNTQIEKAVRAYRDISIIMKDVKDKIQEASNESERLEVQEDVSDEMINIIEAHGLSVEEYNGIMELTEDELRFRNLFLEKLENLLKKTMNIQPDT